MGGTIHMVKLVQQLEEENEDLKKRLKNLSDNSSRILNDYLERNVELEKRLDELMDLMSSLVNFDHFSAEEARYHFINLIYQWHLKNEDYLYKHTVKRRKEREENDQRRL